MIQQFDSLFDLMEAFPTEQAAIDHFRAIRWKNGAFCPHCNSEKIYHFNDGKNHKCGDCRKRFSIRVGTIFEESKIPLRKWFMAIWLITSHKKGIASTQLAKDIKVTQKTAWFMLHRLRHASNTKSFNRPLKNTVEADETFIGGKEKNKHKSKRQNRGRGPVGKTAVIGVLERGGELRMKKMQSMKAKDVQGFVRQNVERGANLMTDDFPGYRGLERDFMHHTVNHSAGEYVRHFILHTNGIESVWALLKRQLIGIHHWISPKHLDRYLSEVTWRFNRRDYGEGQRMNCFLAQTEGRLSYKALIS